MILKKVMMFAAALAAAVFICRMPEVSAYTDLSLVRKCGRSYGYEYLGKCENGTRRQELYNDIYDRACEFWEGSEVPELIGEYYVMDIFDLRLYGDLDEDTALEVLLMLKNDNPIFYFFANATGFSRNRMYVLVSEEYIDGEVRHALQDDILEYVEDRAAELDAKKTAYAKVRSLHDTLVDTVEYERTDGKPSNRSAAHNILGVINDGTGVCEAYARAFELVLNYVGVDNLVVTGIANKGDHAWNMVKLDDDQYYFVDCTWDDLLSTDKYLAAGSETMSSSHELATPEGRGMYFLYELPEASVEDYPGDPDDGSGEDDEFAMGDVNLDGTIDILDAVLLIGYVNGTNMIDDTSYADMNGDGRIDIEDAVRIISYINGTVY